MQGAIQSLSYMGRHDPAVIAGFAFIGSASVLFFHIQLKMIRAGYKTSYSFFGKPFSWNGWDTLPKYLRVRAKHNWSPWPVYLLGPSMLAGIVLLIFGLFRL
jgi:hypothetical protein